MTSGVAAATGRVDLTALCTTMLTGGIREIEVRASSGVKQGSAWSVIPYASASTGHVTPHITLRDALAWITAGKPSRNTTLGDAYDRMPVKAAGTLGMRLTGCRQVRTRIPLTKKGLRGGLVSQLGERYDCATPRRVYVRIRATLATSAPLRRRDGVLRAGAPVVTGALAVRTQAGVALVYTSVAATGQTRLYTARRCVSD